MISPSPYSIDDLDFAVAARVDGTPIIVKGRKFRGRLDRVGIEALAAEADVRFDEALDVLVALGIVRKADVA